MEEYHLGFSVRGTPVASDFDMASAVSEKAIIVGSAVFEAAQYLWRITAVSVAGAIDIACDPAHKKFVESVAPTHFSTVAKRCQLLIGDSSPIAAFAMWQFLESTYTSTKK